MYLVRVAIQVIFTLGIGLVHSQRPCYALGLRATTMTGLLQQPASQYYHLVYGAAADLQLVNSWVLRATYLERPAFSNAGYVDQDFLAYAETGCAFFKIKNLEILSFAGAGRVWGYIKEESSIVSEAGPRRNDYKMNVLSLSMEAAILWNFVDLRFGHSLHVGQGDENQTEANVAWPFSTYYLSLSKFVGLSR